MEEDLTEWDWNKNCYTDTTKLRERERVEENVYKVEAIKRLKINLDLLSLYILYGCGV